VLKFVHRSSPQNLADELSCPADSHAPWRLRSESSSILVVHWTRLRPWVISHFRLLHHVYGIIFYSTSSCHLPFKSLKIVWFLFFFFSLISIFFFCIVPARRLAQAASHRQLHTLELRQTRLWRWNTFWSDWLLLKPGEQCGLCEMRMLAYCKLWHQGLSFHQYKAKRWRPNLLPKLQVIAKNIL